MQVQIQRCFDKLLECIRESIVRRHCQQLGLCDVDVQKWFFEPFSTFKLNKNGHIFSQYALEMTNQAKMFSNLFLFYRYNVIYRQTCDQRNQFELCENEKSDERRESILKQNPRAIRTGQDQTNRNSKKEPDIKKLLLNLHTSDMTTYFQISFDHI